MTWEVALTKRPCRSLAVGLKRINVHVRLYCPHDAGQNTEVRASSYSPREGASSAELTSPGFLSERRQSALALLSPGAACMCVCVWGGSFLHHRRLLKGIEGLHVCLTLTPSWGCLFLPSHCSPAEKQIIP